MTEFEILLLVLLCFVGVGVAMRAFILNEVVQDLREIKYMLEER